jgi:hypothetical protein
VCVRVSYHEGASAGWPSHVELAEGRVQQGDGGQRSSGSGVGQCAHAARGWWRPWKQILRARAQECTLGRSERTVTLAHTGWRDEDDDGNAYRVTEMERGRGRSAPGVKELDFEGAVDVAGRVCRLDVAAALRGR